MRRIQDLSSFLFVINKTLFPKLTLRSKPVRSKRTTHRYPSFYSPPSYRHWSIYIPRWPPYSYYPKYTSSTTLFVEVVSKISLRCFYNVHWRRRCQFLYLPLVPTRWVTEGVGRKKERVTAGLPVRNIDVTKFLLRNRTVHTIHGSLKMWRMF